MVLAEQNELVAWRQLDVLVTRHQMSFISASARYVTSRTRAPTEIMLDHVIAPSIASYRRTAVLVHMTPIGAETTAAVPSRTESDFSRTCRQSVIKAEYVVYANNVQTISTTKQKKTFLYTSVPSRILTVCINLYSPTVADSKGGRGRPTPDLLAQNFFQ